MGGQPSNRPEMVEAARKFMLTPKVRDTPYEEQRLFLLGKGVTESEIDEAKASIPQETGIHNGSAYAYAPHFTAQSQTNRFLSFAQSTALIGCVSYAGYRLVRSFILPRFFDIPDPASEDVRQLQVQVNELQNSIKFVLDSISQTTTMLARQQQEISRALLSVTQRDTDISRLEEGISTVKSLLLSHNNFAPILVPTAKTAELPSWQQAESVSAPTANSGYSTPPANFTDSTEEIGSDKTIGADHAA